MSERRYVMPNSREGWNVTLSRAGHPISSRHTTRQQAIDRARERLQLADGGQLFVMSRNGLVDERETVVSGGVPRVRDLAVNQ
jgi:hypothetical protein